MKTTIKNKEENVTEKIYMHPTLQVLKFIHSGWIYAQKAGFFEEAAMTKEADYLEPHGEVKIEFSVDEDKLDSIFLNAFNYSELSGKSENLNQ